MRLGPDHDLDARLRRDELRQRHLLLSLGPARWRRCLAPLLAFAASLLAGAAQAQGAAATVEAGVAVGAVAHVEAGPAVGSSAQVEEALLHDLETIIDAQESTGWTIDRYEYDVVISDALSSVCASTLAARGAVLATLDARIAALGGPVEIAFEKRGRSLDGLDDLLFATRARALLAMAMERAPAECPFWMTPSAEFLGVQSDAGRFVLNLEGGGLLLTQRDAKAGTVPGGGGSARLLLGYGIDTHFTLLAGGEFGGAALFVQDQVKSGVPIQFVVATPLVLRHHLLTWHHDLEVAPVVFFTQRDGRPSFGGRVGGLLGIKALRVRGIVPWAGIGVAYEAYLESAARSWMWQLKGGARLGFDWDF